MADTIRKRQTYGFNSPLQDMYPLTVIANRAPTTGDLSYPIGQQWINQNTNIIWVLTSVAAGVANWDTIGGVGGEPITAFVVSPDGTGDYTTVQAAVTAANALIVVDAIPRMIYVKGSTYAENLTMYDNITIKGDSAYTIITGVITPPNAGAIFFESVQLTSATNIINSAAAGTTRIRFNNCDFNCTNGRIVNCAAWTGPIDIFECRDTSTISGVVNVGASIVTLRGSLLGNGIATLGVAGGTLVIENSRIACTIIAPTGASTVSVAQGSWIGSTITLAGTSTLIVTDSILSTGAVAALTQSSAGAVTLANCTITTAANPAIAGVGAGAISISGVEFTSNSQLAATLTLAHVPATRTSKVLAGDGVYRVNTVTTETNVIQAYCLDDTAVGASARKAIEGNITMATGNGNATPIGVKGYMGMVAPGNIVMGIGVVGELNQANGSFIASTAAGVEGIMHSYETNAADLPQVYAFGVKGYLIGENAAATPTAGIWAGVGSLVTYNTPMQLVSYGVAVSRLGAGAGTAGRAAFGVCQGTSAIPDWLYGLDLYNTNLGVVGQAYTTADIRYWNQSTFVTAATTNIFNAVAGSNIFFDMGDAIGVNYVMFRTSADAEVARITSRGDISGRNINVTNTNITSFYSNPVLQSAVNTGAAPTGVTGDVNIMMLQDGIVMEEFIIGAGQTIIAPRLADAGLLISLDLTNAEGAEYNFGTTTRSKHVYTIGTSPAFFFEARFTVADVSGCEPLLMGFRIRAANNATYTAYTDYASIGIKTSAFANTITLSTERGGAGTVDTNTTTAFTDGQSHTLRVNVSAAGVVTYLVDGVAPGVVAAYTFTNALQVIPFIHWVQAGAATSTVHLVSLACGLQ